MKHSFASALGASLTLLAANAALCAPTAHIRIDTRHVLGQVTPWMTGSCIEDVNHEIYGGLYDQKIFGESFEEPPLTPAITGWTSFGGNWTAADGSCAVDAESGAKLVRNGFNIGDGSIDVDVHPASDHDGNAGLLVRVASAGVGADNFDGYEISVDAATNQLILGKHQHNFTPLTSAPIPASQSGWHHLRVVLAGPRITVYVGDSQSAAIDYADKNNPLLSGGVALRNWQVKASFRGFHARTLAADITGTFQQKPAVQVSGMWDSIVTGSAHAEFVHSNQNAYNSNYCQTIVNHGGSGTVGVANSGLNRWGIGVSQGHALAGHIYARGTSGERITVALQSRDGSRTYARQVLGGIISSWKKLDFRLAPSATDPRARFAVWIDHPGQVTLDQAVLMGTGNEQFHHLPIRADIAQAMVREGISFLRYGGTMVNVPGYRWKKMIGNPDRRPQYQGNWYPYATNGFGIFDFLNFCEAAHVQAAFAINIEETDQDAADLAEYLVGPTSSRWGHQRALDGHPAPYHVHYIEVGNEESLGGDDPAAYRHYAQRFVAIAHAIHGKAPSIPLVCAAWWRPESANVAATFHAIDGLAAAWDVHVGGDNLGDGRDVDAEITQMQALFRRWDPHTSMKAVIFEENGGLHNLQRALGHATIVNATRSHGDFVLVDCPANCLQPLGQNDNGWDQGQIFFTPSQVWGMPPYYAQQILAGGYQPLHVQTTSDAGQQLSVFAACDASDHRLTLDTVNTGDSAIQANLNLTGFGSVAHATATVLDGPLNGVNTAASPAQITSHTSALAVHGSTLTYTIPPHALVEFRFVSN